MRAKPLVLAPLAALLTAASVTIASGQVGGPDPAPTEPARTGRPAVASVTAEQAQHFGVLRGPRAPHDALGAGARRAIVAGPGPDLGANPDLARRVLAAAASEGLHLVPADGWLCLVSEVGLVSCNRTAEAANGFLLNVEALPDGVSRIRTVLPDGVASVAATTTDGSRVIAPVTQNAAVVDVRGVATSLSWTGPQGGRTVPLPRLPGG